MKAFAKSILLIGVLVMGANGLMAAQAGTTKMSLKELVKQTKALEVTAEAPTAAQGACCRVSSARPAPARRVEQAR